LSKLARVEFGLFGSAGDKGDDGGHVEGGAGGQASEGPSVQCDAWLGGVVGRVVGVISRFWRNGVRLWGP